MSDKETKPEIEWEDQIVCPYCGERDGEYTDYPISLRRDGDTAWHWCSSCDKDFTVKLSVNHSYKSYPAEKSQ